MSRYNKDLGDFGEAMAAEFLNKLHCSVLEQKFRCPEGELDLIAMDGTCLVFVEVKTRTSDRFGYPAEAVTRVKQRKMIQAARQYLIDHPTDGEIRFDVIEVYASTQDGEFFLSSINHIKSAILEVNG